MPAAWFEVAESNRFDPFNGNSLLSPLLRKGVRSISSKDSGAGSTPNHTKID